MLEDLGQALQCSFEIYNPTDGQKWGQISKDGNATGLLGDIMVRELSDSEF